MTVRCRDGLFSYLKWCVLWVTGARLSRSLEVDAMLIQWPRMVEGEVQRCEEDVRLVGLPGLLKQFAVRRMRVRERERERESESERGQMWASICS